MPELKHTFMSGRMNKDLDERLVPNGEYRDAQNIEVLTSESSNMGAVQTCLGNSLISDLVPDEESACVGSVVDDKTNSIYYFIAGDTPLIGSGDGGEGFVHQISQDLVVEYNSINNETLPVIVDIYNVRTEITKRNPNKNNPLEYEVSSTAGLRIGMRVNVTVSAALSWTQQLPRPIITAIPTSTTVILSSVITGTALNSNLTNNNAFNNSSVDVTVNFTSGSSDDCCGPGGRVLNFNKGRLITGVNIIDDMLFWTDNYSEPKKVNITRGKEGSIPALGICRACKFNHNTANPYIYNGPTIPGTTHTELVVNGATVTHLSQNGILLNPPSGIQEYIQEKHITVIKKSPLTPPRLEMYDSVHRFDPSTRLPLNVATSGWQNWHGRLDGGATTAIYPVGTTSIEANSPANGGTMGNFAPATRADYRVGDVLLLTDIVSAAIDPITGDPLPFSGNDVRVKLQVISSDSTATNPTLVWSSGSGGNLNVKILYINSEIDPATQNPIVQNQFATWYVRLEDETQHLYELKFPKFGYRYKYEDGEYSAFSPFSEIAFLAQEYEYDHENKTDTTISTVVKGYNTGMMNGLKQLFVKDFIPPNIPLDVVEIDILYKESNSPNIYTIRTFDDKDPEWIISGTGDYKGYFEIKDDLIHAVVASNQLLRPWDNVPRKALGQEVTGNRLIYGNYLQNYDLTAASSRQVKPEFKTFIENNQVDVFKFPETSLKSMRTYQLGVVYKDVYGRETPVITHPSGVVKLDASKAVFNNKFSVQTITPPPFWADSFKYFVKEVSNEYYNLAMDRWYDADLLEYDKEKHHIWMSFASEDRNKVDEETTLILKKSGITPTNTSGFVATTPRHKILAIENEAPDFIKTTYEVMGEWVATDDTQGGTIGNFYDASPVFGVPYIGFKEIRIPKEQWEKSTFSSLQNKDNSILSGSILDRGSSLVVRLIENTSNPDVGTWFNISNISYHASSTATEQHYVISIDDFFDSDGVEYFVGGGASELDIIANINVEIAKKTIESRPEFDGRFFVKVERSDELIHNLGGLNTQITTSSSWMNTGVSFDSLFLYGDTYNRSSYDASTLQTSGFDNSIYPGWNFGALPYPVVVNGVVTIGSTTYNRFLWSEYSCSSGSSYPAAGIPQGNGINPATNIGTWICDQENYSPPFRAKEDWDILYNANGAAGSTGFWFIDSEPGISTTNISTGNGHGFNLKSHGRGADIGNHKITISLAGCNGNYNGSNQFVIPAPQQTVYDALTTPGSKFKFNDDPDKIIYEIGSATTTNVYNYDYKYTILINQTWEFWDDEIQRKRIQLTLIEPGTAANPVNKAIGQQVSPVFLTGSTGGFNAPTTYAPCDYTDIGGPSQTPNQASETNALRISFVELETNSSSSTTETSFSADPAVWETEPKENVGLDIYYEIGQAYPVNMCDGTEELYIQPGATVSMYQSNPNGTFVRTGGGWTNSNVSPNISYSSPTPTTIITDPVDPTVVVSITGCAGDVPSGSTQPSTQVMLNAGQVLDEGDILSFTNPDGTIVTATVAFDSPGSSSFGQNEIYLYALVHGENQTLPYYNCYTFGNGVESNRIRDLFNAVTIDKGVKASTTLAEQYKEENRKSGLIFSGIYNSMNGVNRLNQFIMAENITKDLNPEYGSIQKLHTRDDDLVTLCEDKIVKVLANKDALYNADDTKNITASRNVLGYADPFVGEFGISKNPESFASEAFRAYFTDKERGAVMRLSRDGLTPISNHGMKDWFADNLKTADKLIGNYDSRKSLYNVTLKDYASEVADSKTLTVSFSERSKGWVSFKTIDPEIGFSLNNEYYTAKNGRLWRHHDDSVDRNSFYAYFPNEGVINSSSSITVLFNDLPSVVKSFTTLNYEGSQSRIIENLAGVGYMDSNGVTTFSTDNKHYNNQPEFGWYVDAITTDQQTGTVAEFVNKEGKWFNYIIGEETVWKNGVITEDSIAPIYGAEGNLDTKEFSTQGIGVLAHPPVIETNGGGGV